MQNKKVVLLAKALVVVALIAAVSAVIYAKRGPGFVSAAPQVEEARQPATPMKPVISAPTPANAKPVPRLVDIGADKCIPCKMMDPILQELRTEYAGRMEVVFVDVWKNPDAGKQYNIDLIPTQVFYDTSGKEIFRHQGFFSKEDILATWKKLGVEFSTGI